MKKKYIAIALVAVVVVAGATVWLSAAPSIGAVAANPAFVVVNTPTDVLFTAHISDMSVISTGVNLLKVDASGKTLAVIGTMRDEGIGGDVVAGDKMFSYRTSISRFESGPEYYQVSAAFSGFLQRVKSPVMSVTFLDPIGPPTIQPLTVTAGKAVVTARVAIPNSTQPPSVTIIGSNAAIADLLDNGLPPDETPNDSVFSGLVPIEGTAGARLQLSASITFPSGSSPIVSQPTTVQFKAATPSLEGVIGVAGGELSGSTGLPVVSFPPNAVTGPITFSISEKRRNELPEYIPNSVVVHGAVDISPDEASEDTDSDLSSTFSARVTASLYDRLAPGSTLRVVYFNPSSKSLHKLNSEAQVDSDGLSAWFSTTQIGLLLIIQ